MRVIWKYTLDFDEDETKYHVPIGGIIRFVGCKEQTNATLLDEAAIWMEVDTDNQKEIRTFKCICTGKKIPKGKYVGSFITMRHIVFHVYEI